MNALQPLSASLPVQSVELLNSLSSALSEDPAVWLVGGTLRDLLRDQQPSDYDIAFASDKTPQIRRWARAFGGSWFWLDAARNQSRVVFRGQKIQFDFAPLRAVTIEADLCLRDFTINAMAVPLGALQLMPPALIDPTGGYDDLTQGVLRRCGVHVLAQDPLRILKGIRHQAQQGWQIESRTRAQIQQLAPLLEQVAAERIRSELGRIFSAAHLTPALFFLEETGLLTQLFGIATTSKPFALPMQPVFAARHRLERHPQLAALLNTLVEEGLSCAGLLLLAQLLKLADQKNPRATLKKLRFSARSCALVQRLISGPLSLSAFNTASSARVLALQVEMLEPYAVEQLLAALIQQHDGHADEFFARLIVQYRQQQLKQQIEPLLSGQQIMQITGLPPGEAIGIWQKKIKLAEIAGEIADQPAAVKWLQTKFSN